MRGVFQFLGTGSSTGVPMIGCKCAVCTSKSPKNQRFRASALLRIAGKSILIDMGPDFRSQALKFGVDHLDGFILTHTHYDHIAGIDEARIFNARQKRPMPCLLSQDSFNEVKKRYDYFFRTQANMPAQFDFQQLQEMVGETVFLGVKIQYCHFEQGSMKVTGLRLGDLAYISDIKKYDDSIFPFLNGVKTLVLSALRPEPSPFHLSFEEAAQFAQVVGAKETYLTHVGHFLDHEAMNALLPPNVQVGYDGLKLEFQCTN